MNMNKSVLTAHQPSLTEWFAAIGEVAESEAFREEDNHKTSRLEILYQTIGLPYERPEELSAKDLKDQTPAFAKLLAERGAELCAIRLVPTQPTLPKLRNRGQTLRDCYHNWFLKQDINPNDYIAYICPHSETLLWSATFVVNEDAIFGEIVAGLHSELTHGDTKSTVYHWRYDFDSKAWQWSERNEEAAKQVARMILLLKVDTEKQPQLHRELEATFAHDYLMGYFESTVWPDGKVYIIDYNRLLPHSIATPPPFVATDSDLGKLTGMPAQPGMARGPVIIVSEENVSDIDFPEGSILVCDNTDVRYLPLMRKAAGIVTNRGGVLSHAAIIARELGIPCLVGTKNATHTFKNGEQVEVNANTGTVQKFPKKIAAQH